VDVLAVRGVGALATWEPWACCSADRGALLGQSAYSSGALSLSLPVLDTLAPIVAVVIAATVFDEKLASSAWQLGLQLAGGAVAVAGIAVLSRRRSWPPRPRAARACAGPDGGRGARGGVITLTGQRRVRMAYEQAVAVTAPRG